MLQDMYCWELGSECKYSTSEDEKEHKETARK
jgi:hypothetical protein